MVSAHQEKYLWQIYKNVDEDGSIRVSQLANALQVSRPSVSKIAKKLDEEGFVEFQRYGRIVLTEKGSEIGQSLSSNYEVLIRFFQLLDLEEEKMKEEVDKIQFYIGSETIDKLDSFLISLERK